jgi:hypothetical protein
MIMKAATVRIPKGKRPQDTEGTQHHQAQPNCLYGVSRSDEAHGEPGDDQYCANHQSHAGSIPHAP